MTRRIANPPPKKRREGRGGGGRGLGAFVPKNLKPPPFFLFPPPLLRALTKLTAGWIQRSGVVVANVIREIAVVNEVSVVSITRIVLAPPGDGLILTSGLAP